MGGERNLTGNIIANVHQVAGYLYTIDSDAIITNVYDEFGSLEQSTRDSETGYPDTTVSGINGKQDLRINFRAPIYEVKHIHSPSNMNLMHLKLYQETQKIMFIHSIQLYFQISIPPLKI